ncbi:PKD domain-containing protein [Aurantibacter crassamenti]|uniref:PKD domain-containing protein n=1 Tax=Aurantibacter crassamenti TaxID=1837375 RepID=UPI001939FA50|nr:PKD domain-containing protein [Aurantibacter crassamenti]MBM1105915.1 PKD domain-containing protein [Aurantibacter crassamenti]
MNNTYILRFSNCLSIRIDNYTSTISIAHKSFIFILIAGFSLITSTTQAQCGSEPFPNQWAVHEYPANPYTAVYTFANYDLDGDGLKDIVTGGWWYKNSGVASDDWTKSTIGGNFGNVAHVHDFDNDGDMDLLGTTLGSSGTEYQSVQLVWAENDGSGIFTVHTNLPTISSTWSEPFLAGLAGGDFGSGGTYQMAINWNGAENTNEPVQLLTPTATPTTGTWSLETISNDSSGEDLQAADIDDDGDLDLFQGVNWLENNGTGVFTTHLTGLSYGSTPDRAQLADFDGDGDLDAVVGQLGYGSNSNRYDFAWFEAPADPTQTWVKHLLSTDVHGSLSVFAADIDFDGDKDIIVGEWLGSRRLMVFENNLFCNEDWEMHVIDDSPQNWEHHDGARVVDIDNDGDLDIISNGFKNQKVVRIYENLSTVVINSQPTANAGSNKSITLPTNSSTINGTGNDPDGGNVTFAWTQTSGPNTATLSNNTTANLSANNLIEGTYVFRLTVTDDENDTDFDEMSVTVNPAPNTDIPIVNAGNNQNITLPSNSIIQNGSGNDPDGGTVTFEWTQTSGPNTATLSNNTTANLSANNLIEGTYVFRLTVTDDENDTDFDEMSVTVNPAPNTDIPIANAGNNQNITLPSNSIIQNGSGNDPDGGNVTFAWTQTSGPNTATLSNNTTSNLSANNLIEGTYVFRLTVTDDENDTAFDEMSVIVNAESQTNTDIPLVNAGNNQSITLPTNSITLIGSGSDPDGGTVTFEWTQTSGPNTAALANSNTAILNTSSLIEGTYVFQLTATDDENDTAFDETTVTVLAIGNTNQPPTAIAESNIITGEAPLTVLFTGNNSTDDTAINSYDWNFGNNETSVEENPTYTFNNAGTYLVELTVTDSEGLTNTASINITVSASESISEETGVILELNPAQEGVARILLKNQPLGIVVTSLLLHDSTGRFIESFNIERVATTQDTYELPITTLRDGLYFISLELNSGEYKVLSLLIQN